MKKKLFLLPLVAIIALMISCKPTSKNELNKYNNNQKTIKKYAVKYPAFKTFMVTISQSAEKIMNKAIKITEEEKKALEMEKANKVFSDSDFYTQLSSYDGRLERLREKIKKLQNTRIKKIYHNRVREASSTAYTEINKTLNIMRDAKPVNMTEAYEKVKEVNGILISAESSFDRVKKEVTKTSTRKRKSWKKKH